MALSCSPPAPLCAPRDRAVSYMDEAKFAERTVRSNEHDACFRVAFVKSSVDAQKENFLVRQTPDSHVFYRSLATEN